MLCDLYDRGMASRSATISVPVVVDVDPAGLKEACRRWKIAELDVFGSVARGDAQIGSDVDLLVTFLPDAEWSLLDHVSIENELSALFGRRVDLVTRRAVERSGIAMRREEILASARPVHIS